MDEFFRDATSNQLLILLCFPVTGAIALVAFLVFYSRRGRNTSKMKLGIQPSNKTRFDPPPQKTGSAAGSLSAQAATPPSTTETELNLGILGGAVANPSTVSLPQEQPIDLAARLGADSSRSSNSELGVASAAMPPLGAMSIPVSNPVSTNDALAADAAELLRLLRHPATGQLIVEVAGSQYTKLTDIDNREVGQYILELAAHVLAFTNGVVATRSGVKSVYLPKVEQTPEPLVKFTPVSKLPDPDQFTPSQPEKSQKPLVPPPPPQAEAAFLASLKNQPLGQPAPPPPQSRGFFKIGGSSGESAKAVPQFNLAGEINQIVQARLLASPLAETTTVEVVSDYSGGIRIKVNGQVYSGPDDIPDPAIKALIKESIKQWERS
jgi:hypothetical protein